jgi:cytochrome c biogenesis protein CcdA
VITIMGLAVSFGGLGVVLHSVIVLANNRGEATRYWYSLYNPHDRNDPILRRMRVIRSVGAAVELVVGLFLIALGILFLQASFG